MRMLFVCSTPLPLLLEVLHKHIQTHTHTHAQPTYKISSQPKPLSAYACAAEHIILNMHVGRLDGRAAAAGCRLLVLYLPENVRQTANIDLAQPRGYGPAASSHTCGEQKRVNINIYLHRERAGACDTQSGMRVFAACTNTCCRVYALHVVGAHVCMRVNMLLKGQCFRRQRLCVYGVRSCEFEFERVSLEMQISGTSASVVYTCSVCNVYIFFHVYMENSPFPFIPGTRANGWCLCL